MKSAIIATGVLSALIMTGCATSQSTKADTKQPHSEHHHTKDGKRHHGDKHPHGDKHHHGDKKSHHGKAHHGKHGEVSKDYTCEGNATVKATYNPDDKKALLNITAPSLKLNGEQLTLSHTKDGVTQAHQGRGFSFSSDSHEWHAVGKEGLLTLKSTNQTLKCQTQHPIHHGMPKDHRHKMPKDQHHTKPDSTTAK